MDPNNRVPPPQLDPHLKPYYSSSNNSDMGLKPHCNPHPHIPPNLGSAMTYPL